MAKKFGGFPGGGMNNMNNMIRQAQKMQQEMEKVQDDMNEQEIEASAGGGMVTVKITGKKHVKEVIIKPEAVDPDDIEMLQDLVAAAINEAITKAEQMMESKMSKLTGGINLPGLF